MENIYLLRLKKMLLLVFFLLNTLDTSYIRKSSLNEERISENNIHY